MEFLRAFIIVFEPVNFLLLTSGVILGIVVGAIPGLTATLAISLLLPFTFGLSAIPALIMLLGIYVGGIYGGSITAILIRTPGTPGAAATALDGYPLTQQGLGGKALGVATTASFFGGILSAAIMIWLSPIISSFALKFSSAEYFALAFFGLTIIFSVSGKSLLKGAVSGTIGLLIASVGLDKIAPYPRFTFGISNLIIGFPLLPAVIGLFAIAEVFRMFENPEETTMKVKAKIGRILPTLKELKGLLGLYFKSGLIGTFIGALPGAGANVASFLSYSEAKRTSKTPEKFGTGMIEGVAASEAANNAVTGGALIPMLTLGIPGDAVTAVLLGALTIQGLQPGPLLFRNHMNVIQPLFAGLLVANLVMLISGLSMAPFVARIATLKKTTLLPAIAIFALIGAFATEGSLFHMKIALGFGILGYILEKYEFPVAPIALAIILGPLAETSFRTALIRSRGDMSVFFTRPISVILIALAFASIIYTLYRNIMYAKRQINLSE
ncbi:MAG: tripartite tricarboxylate transporter permease [Dethiobacter sp.]|nr:tripartite tricarboxylate transporter permease [Dethiobacter sp.]